MPNKFKTTGRWLDTGCLREKPQKVVRENGVIKGVKVCSAGEAKGHGYHLDQEFIETVTSQGSGLTQGLKARFGHPNMCSEALGTYVGRFKNFTMGTTKREGGMAACCFADLHLSDTAKVAPAGNLHEYLLQMAENEADVFGTSIVFEFGRGYRKTAEGQKVYPVDQEGKVNEEYRSTPGPEFMECKNLRACDCVDEPAANDGLFSAFSVDTVAGQITEFLDLHPEVFSLLTENTEIIEAISQYGNRFDEFLARYQEQRAAHVGLEEETINAARLAAMEDTPMNKKEFAAKYPELHAELAADALAQAKAELAAKQPDGSAALAAEQGRLFGLYGKLHGVEAGAAFTQLAGSGMTVAQLEGLEACGFGLKSGEQEKPAPESKTKAEILAALEKSQAELQSGGGGAVDFMAAVDAEVEKSRCTRTEAMKRVARTNPALHEAYKAGSK